ncbi:unnamed protein product [Lactuca saligna]|uniref:Uncharacterized protein n=1 Tax=Lactuca saligna TaxID=75948 RepID=A0AA35ZF77_LACSI|nr:unnamed protein product [Lactuca saligna]
MFELALRVGIKARGGTGTFVCKSCSFSPILDSELVPDRFRLTEEERVVNIIEVAAGELECLFVVIASKLQKLFLFANIDVEERSNSSTIFSRLSYHAEEDVRKQHEGILVMLAKQSPWSIIYPTLVDINTGEEDHSVKLT